MAQLDLDQMPLFRLDSPEWLRLDRLAPPSKTREIMDRDRNGSPPVDDLGQSVVLPVKHDTR